MSTPSTLITRGDAARVLGISLRTLDDLTSRGELPVVRVGKAVRIRPSSIEDFINSRETRINPKRR